VSTVALLVAAVMLTYTICTATYKSRLNALYLGSVTQGEVDAYDKLDLIRALFERYSYLGVDDEAALDAVIRAYVSLTGDRYAVYYNAEEYAEHLQSSAGNMVGIGITVTASEIEIDGVAYRVLDVIGVTADGCADIAGVKLGDKIAWVGAEGAETLVGDMADYNSALASLKGESGTFAEFSVFRETDSGYEKIHFSIERRIIDVPTAKGRVSTTDKTVGIVRISRFNSNTPAQFDRAMDELIEAGCKSFVFDVRGNPGGSLDSVIAIASRFLNSGERILSTVDADGTTSVITVQPVTNLTGDAADCNVTEADIGKYRSAITRMAVLCDGNSASAAELFTAVIRDYALGTIVGVKTYGKGSMQSIIPLAMYGYMGGLRLTSKMYFPPSGEGYDGVGIFPTENYNIELSEEALRYSVDSIPEDIDDQLLAALESFK
jgi:carboxyl-terminal processing protease